MYQSIRSRRREEPDSGKGMFQVRKQTSASEVQMGSSYRCGSSTEENSFALEFDRSSSSKATWLPIKMLIEEEVSKKVQIRHSSPSVIARLMGLDSVPSSHLSHGQHKNIQRYVHSPSSVGSEEKYVFSEDLSRRRSTDELPELKDVFEVMESSELKVRKNQKNRKGRVSSRHNETDMDFIRQKFMDAKRLSTDDHSSKEFDDAIEVLESNKDLLLDFLDEPNSLFTKHLHDLNCSPPPPPPPPPQASHITILKPSKCNKSSKPEMFSKLGRDSERLRESPKKFRSSYRKPAIRPESDRFSELSGSRTCKLSKSTYEEKNGACTHPTRIVVLKPSLEKAQNMEGAISLTREIFRSGYRRPMHFSCSGARELFSEGTARPELSDSFELVLGPKARGSREIAREIAKQMRKTVHHGGAKKLSQILPHMDKLDNLDMFQISCDLHDDWNRRLSPSSTHSSESSVSREARKRLSERWKMTHQFQDGRSIARGSSTLADMLALSDRDAPKAMKSSNQTRVSSVYPTSKYGWKDGNLISSPISKSPRASSTSRRSPEYRKRKENGRTRDFHIVENLPNMDLDDSADGRFSKQGRSEIRNSKYHFDKACLANMVEDEISLPEREIHVSSEELRKSIHVKNLSRQEFMHPALSIDALSEGDQLVDISLVTDCQDATCTLTAQAKQEQQHLASAIVGEDEKIITANLDNSVLEEVPVDYPQVDPIPSPFKAPEPISPVSSNEGEPSPVSVLDSSLEEENSSSICFGRISADLQELRMQLRLLKLESADPYAEESKLFIVSDEESVGESQPLCPTGEINQTFRNEEERDFSYLLDMLIDLNAHITNQDGLLGSCYSLDSPVGPAVFGKLEKKYSELILWSRSERKLLFDLINFILADMVSSKLDLNSCAVSKWYVPKWDREGLVEEVWQRVISRRRDMGCGQEGRVSELKWLDSEAGVEIVGRDIESMLCDELVEELITNIL